MNKLTPLSLIALSVALTSPLISGHRKRTKRPIKELIHLGYNHDVAIKNGKLDLSYKNLDFDYYSSLSFLRNIVERSQNLQCPITHLDLTGNNITELPACIGKLASLQSLKLSSNPLESLPSSLAQLTNLRLLILPDENTGKKTIEGHAEVQEYLRKTFGLQKNKPLKKQELKRKTCCHHFFKRLFYQPRNE